ncbi:MAG: ribonuclease R [Bacteroidetes bacterium HGW-Bacteroidetes-17]|jgi:ribonuclease R|nr:MAG: ribonuclease R [Bacteroidetes bacterium HGW-Bacteroidetes-17]
MAKSTDKNKKLKGKSTFIASILSVFGKNPYRPFNYKQISAQLGIKDKASKDLVAAILKEMAAGKDIVETKLGKYKLNPEALKTLGHSSSYITGIVDMKNTGKAYILPDEGGDDIFISANNTFRAMDGDHVKVMMFPQRKGRKIEGQIVEVLKRVKENYVGVLEVSENFAFLVPDNANVPVHIFIPKSQIKGAKNGEKVIVKLTEWPEHSKNPFGEVTQVLGMPGNNDVEMQSILAEFDFPLSFPKHVEKAADEIPKIIPKEEIAKRRDFRNSTTFTIDPLDAKDFDDALSIQKLASGNWEVGVHIADVSHYVEQNSTIDKEALNRGTSIYLVDRVIPMLPEVLSNELCSLRPNEDKLCFSAVFEMDDHANILTQWFGKTVINSDRRFTYEEVQEIIESNAGEFLQEINTLNHLAKILRDKRFKNGSINFHSEDIRFNLDENGKPLSVYVKEQKDSNRLIEDFMLLANKKVAEFIGKTKSKKEAKTFVYRIHDEPNPEKLNTFIQFITKLGYTLNINTRGKLADSFNQLFEKIHGKGEANMIETIAIRTMSKAEYSTHNIGHYGLAFSHYSHFTSPIRRYPDLITHRILHWYLNGHKSVNQNEYEKICLQASELERRAEKAERESIKYKQAEYMLEHIGKRFSGLISGVSKWGLFVQIEENKCEGMVRLRDMKDDFYYLDEDNYQVIGQRSGDKYKLGDRVYIFVKKIDLSKKQVDFELVN